MRSSPRTLLILAALAAPWLSLACGLSPLTPPVETTTTSTTVTTSSTTDTDPTTISSSSTATGSTTSASTSSTSSNSGGAGGQAGSGGATGAGGQTSTGGQGGTGGITVVDAGPPACNTTITQYAVDPSPHIPACWPVTYSSNPPTSGPHYPIWAAFKTYGAPVPRGFWVHSLEHGAIVISYNCPSGCAAELADLAAWLDARPADPLCLFGSLKSRVIVTPDPELDVRFAASAWGWALRSGCLDLSLLGPFMDAHYGHGPEDFCIDGTDVLAPDAGFPADCGQSIPDGG